MLKRTISDLLKKYRDSSSKGFGGQIDYMKNSLKERWYYIHKNKHLLNTYDR